nr:MAG TPA: hypothetical protein [Caudoviricetes sp.]
MQIIPFFNLTEYRLESWRWSLTVTLNQGSRMRIPKMGTHILRSV